MARTHVFTFEYLWELKMCKIRRPKIDDVDSTDGKTPGSVSLGPHSCSGTLSLIVDGAKRENMITVLFSAPLVFRDDKNK